MLLCTIKTLIAVMVLEREDWQQCSLPFPAFSPHPRKAWYSILVPRANDPFGQHQGPRQIWLAKWNTSIPHMLKISAPVCQRSWSLVLTRRIAAFSRVFPRVCQGSWSSEISLQKKKKTEKASFTQNRRNACGAAYNPASNTVDHMSESI